MQKDNTYENYFNYSKDIHYHNVIKDVCEL